MSPEEFQALEKAASVLTRNARRCRTSLEKRWENLGVSFLLVSNLRDGLFNAKEKLKSSEAKKCDISKIKSNFYKFLFG